MFSVEYKGNYLLLIELIDDACISGPNSFLWFGPWPRLNVVDPVMIREILKKNDVYQKPLPEMGKILSGGLVVLEGEKWAKHRKIVNPAFHLDKLKVSAKHEM